MKYSIPLTLLTLLALRKAKIAYNFGLSECNRVKERVTSRLVTRGTVFARCQMYIKGKAQSSPVAAVIIYGRI